MYRRSQYEPGTMLVDAEGVISLVINFSREGHQYERYNVYTVLTQGRVSQIDDFNIRSKSFIKFDTSGEYV